MSSSTPVLLVGLGNPGCQYEGHRHNVGFMAIDEIVRRWKFTGPQSKFSSDLYSGTIDGQKIVAIKPQTYMNESGRAVQPAAAFYKIPLDRVIVIHDELDLLPGQVRIKQGGGAGGHNGLRSIDQVCGGTAEGNNYHRLRFGIGHPGHKDRVHGYVLSDFTADERANLIEPLLATLADTAPLLVNFKAAEVQNKLALKLQALMPS